MHSQHILRIYILRRVEDDDSGSERMDQRNDGDREANNHSQSVFWIEVTL